VKKILRPISIILTVVMVMFVFMTSAAAGPRNDRGCNNDRDQKEEREWRNDRGRSDDNEQRERRNEKIQKIWYLLAGVEIINDQPTLTTKTSNENAIIPIQLSERITVNGQTTPLVIEQGAVVVSTKNGSVAIPLDDFDVVMINGQIMLKTNTNPLILIPIAFYGLAGAAAGGGLAALFGATKKIIAISAIGGGLIGGAYGATRQ